MQGYYRINLEVFWDTNEESFFLLPWITRISRDFFGLALVKEEIMANVILNFLQLFAALNLGKTVK